MKIQILSIDHKIIFIWFRNKIRSLRGLVFIPKLYANHFMIDRKNFIFHQKISFFSQNFKFEI